MQFPKIALTLFLFILLSVYKLQHICRQEPEFIGIFTLSGVLVCEEGGVEVTKARLRVVSNFGDGDCGAGEIHTRARESSRRR